MVKAARSFQCQRCSRAFARLEHLQRHDRSHTKEKPYICDQCPKSFTRQDLLARHQRLSHSPSSNDNSNVNTNNANDTTPQSVPTDHVLDGLNILASAVADRSVSTPHGPQPQGPAQHPLSASQGSSFTSVLPAAADQTTLAGHNLRLAAQGTADATTSTTTTAFAESLSGYAAANAYDGDDFTSFLDSIPLPSHPYSPTYQPLPLFPGWPLDPTAGYDGTAATEGNAKQSRPVLPRHGTQLPSLQPEESDAAYQRARPPRIATISVTAQCRNRIAALLADYSNVLPNAFLLSRHALSRCLTGYLTGYHDHYPFIHIPTLDIDRLSLPLFLSMAALGARYCREPDTSSSLYHIARTVTLEHIRRRYQFPTAEDDSEKLRLANPPTPENQDLLETIQALLLLHSVASWFKRDPAYSESLSIRSVTETLLRMGGLNELPEQDGSWKSWVRRECVKRTILTVFCFLNILTIVFDLPPMILAEEFSLDLPCTEKEWQAARASAWLQERRQVQPEPKLQDALSSLFAPAPAAKAHLESFSSLGGYVLIHAILQDIWLLQKARRLRLARNRSLSTTETLSLEQALEHWCQCWERNQESSIDPFNPHGPLSFTSTALLRLAYIRLNADFTAARQLQTWNPDRIARSLRENLCVQRGDRLTRAALHCAHALSTPIKLGINYVAHTQVVSWSNQYALCSLECAVLLAKWLEAATEANPVPALTEQESKLLEFVIEMVMETQHGVTREWLLGNNARLSAIVTRLWARLFTADYIWELVNLIGRSLGRYADLLDGDMT
ncbi:transcription factor domain-containing protein [Aspergillus clavatus NRRL 1]|uniref:C2H2 transcription factor, putative n=1 Tax=Aspergillus clavatus (strain ATCC 1007 / CBS 513.65 / DSM 816 / NCTC 3887 / NRRL 1 / QM 1276 / 107) TaxID=344612 RepID=A1CCM1_ASPCL|nr:C2H2 transcription factor, putative [Aspergillus clavatus NRRL 1]EAW12278.1 C2H2 transcription factor, putative [Aspergillus clavatus NRRL 1]